MDDPSRRYTREEMERIIEAASEAEPSTTKPLSATDEFTLAEIKEIAGEVGIDPVRVEEASRALVQQIPLKPRVSLGTYQLERRFERLLTPDEMRFVAQEADSYFGVEGRIRQTDGYLEWQSSAARTFVGLVNEAGRTRVRVIMDRGSQFLFGGGLIGVAGFSFILKVVSVAAGTAGVVSAGGVAALTIAAIAGFSTWRRAVLMRRMEALLKMMTEGPVSLREPKHD